MSRILLDKATADYHKHEVISPGKDMVYLDWLAAVHGREQNPQNNNYAKANMVKYREIYPQQYLQAIDLYSLKNSQCAIPKTSVYFKKVHFNVASKILEAVSNCKDDNERRHFHAMVLQCDASRYPSGHGAQALKELADKEACKEALDNTKDHTYPLPKHRAFEKPNCPYQYYTETNDQQGRALVPAVSEDENRCPSNYFRIFLNGRIRSANGYTTLQTTSGHAENTSTNLSNETELSRALIQAWDTEGIKYRPFPDVHKEPGACADHDNTFYVYGPGRPLFGTVDPDTDITTYQTQTGHFMRLGVKAGAQNVNAGEKYWIANKKPPLGSKSAWITSSTGKMQEVWFSDAKTALEEEQRASAGNRPIYQLFDDIKPWEKYEDNRHQSQAKPLVEPAAATVLTGHQEGNLVVSSSKTYAEVVLENNEEYYPTIRPAAENNYYDEAQDFEGDASYGESEEYSGSDSYSPYSDDYSMYSSGGYGYSYSMYSR